MQPSYSSYFDDQRQGGQSDLVSYPLGHLGSSRSDRGSNNRNDRNRNQNRDRYRNNNNNNNNNRSQGNRGGPSNQGPGILGAKPGDRAVPELPANPLQVPGLVKLTVFLISNYTSSCDCCPSGGTLHWTRLQAKVVWCNMRSYLHRKSFFFNSRVLFPLYCRCF